MPSHDIIVMGASAGGVEALMTLTRQLPADLPAAVFIVLHIPAQSPSMLPAILNRSGNLPVAHASDGATIELGKIYVAPPDYHLMLEPKQIRLVRGPKENRHRPAIDPLFRSAALNYGSRVIGVILTGALDDGTAGLLAVKQCGGMAIVQDPHEATYPSMPQSAIAHVPVDYVLPLAGIASTLDQLSHEPAAERDAPMSGNSNRLERETRIAEMDMDELSSDEPVGKPSAFACPECGGVLWELNDGDLLRFRCRVGHAYTVESVFAEQAVVLEDALWAALRTLQESASLSRRMIKRAREQGQTWLVSRFEDKLREDEKRAALIRSVLLREEPVVAAVP